jgi:hypothetical protein
LQKTAIEKNKKVRREHISINIALLGGIDG